MGYISNPVIIRTTLTLLFLLSSNGFELSSISILCSSFLSLRRLLNHGIKFRQKVRSFASVDAEITSNLFFIFLYSERINVSIFFFFLSLHNLIYCLASNVSDIFRVQSVRNYFKAHFCPPLRNILVFLKHSKYFSFFIHFANYSTQPLHVDNSVSLSNSRHANYFISIFIFFIVTVFQFQYFLYHYCYSTNSLSVVVSVSGILSSLFCQIFLIVLILCCIKLYTFCFHSF